MVLDRPIPNAVLGEDYVNIWNAETMESVAGRDFILAGWGSSGELREDGSTDHHGIEIFHRGYNNVNEIRNNMLVYTMDQDGLPLEAMGHSGDSGSGAFIDIDGTLLIAGVKSNGEGATWGSENEYTRVGGIAQPWIEANLASLDAEVENTNCEAYPPNFHGEEEYCGQDGGDGDQGDGDQGDGGQSDGGQSDGGQGDGSQGEGSQGDGSQGDGSQGGGSQGDGSQGGGSQGDGSQSDGSQSYMDYSDYGDYGDYGDECDYCDDDQACWSECLAEQDDGGDQGQDSEYYGECDYCSDEDWTCWSDCLAEY